MSDFDIKINTKEIDNIVNKMSKNLEKLKEENNNINDAYLSLDESKWQGSDKKKIDSSFGDYLKKMTNLSDNILNTINVLKTGVSKYEELEKQIDNDLQELEDL